MLNQGIILLHWVNALHFSLGLFEHFFFVVVVEQLTPSCLASPVIIEIATSTLALLQRFMKFRNWVASKSTSLTIPY